MCGIVGYIGKRQAAPILIEGLHRLEYRGYDSAGIAVAQQGQAADRQAQGPRARARRPAAAAASRARPASPIRAGRPTASRATATPIPTATATGRYAVVHNGIIENAAALRAQLADARLESSPPTPTPRCSPI